MKENRFYPGWHRLLLLAIFISVGVGAFLVSAMPLTWDEIVYMQAAYLGEIIPLAPFRTAHVLALKAFMTFAAPLEAAKLAWSVETAAIFVLPLCYLFSFRQRAAVIASALAVYLCIFLSFDFYWWTPGIVYADYTVAVVYAASLAVWLAPGLGMAQRSVLLGALFSFGCFVKETGLPLSLLPAFMVIGEARNFAQAWKSLILPYSLGLLVAALTVCLASALFLDLSITRFSEIYAAWTQFYFNPPARDGTTFLSYLMRVENPSLFAILVSLSAYAAHSRDRVFSACALLAWSLLALLSAASFFSIATVAGRYMIPVVPVVMFAFCHAVIAWERDRTGQVLSGFLIPLLLGWVLCAALYYSGITDILAERYDTSISVVNKSLIVPFAALALMGALALSAYLSRIGSWLSCSMIALLALYPTMDTAGALIGRQAATRASHRFEEMEALAAVIRAKDGTGPARGPLILMGNGFYASIRTERGDAVIRAMLSFFLRRPLTNAQAHYVEAPPESGRYWYITPRETDEPPEGLELLGASGPYALYRRN